MSDTEQAFIDALGKDPDSLTKLAWADWCEENDQLDTAITLRFLDATDKWPKGKLNCDSDKYTGWSWYWYRGDTSWSLGEEHFDLPEWWFTAVPAYPRNKSPKTFDSLKEAIEASAEGLKPMLTLIKIVTKGSK
jgi:hypothetical protein